jgi:phosphate transport system substrate-binding protein
MATLSTKTGKCSNFGNCSLADSRSPVEVPGGQDFVCTECGKSLVLSAGGDDKGPGARRMVLLIGGALLVGGGVLWSMLGGNKGATTPSNAGTATAPVVATPALPAGSTVLMRVAGSNTLGSKLVPALAETYLKNEGATSVQRVPGAAPVEMSVQGRFADGAVKSIEIAAHGSSTAFAGLGSGAADVGMSSRRINLAEVTQLAALGDMTSPAAEHVVGLDGLAVIVNKANAVPMLTKAQLASIFTGQISDWSQLGAAARGKTGQIKLYARDEKSGTFDSFQQMVLGQNKLAAGARRFEDSAQLSVAVSGDPDGIGFIGLPYVLSARAVGVADKGALALLPNRFTVATEDYVLSRRLYLYSAVAPANPNVLKFVAFAKSKAGQDIVAQNGFVEQTVQAEATASAVDASAPAEYRQATTNATRLSLNFRFRTGSKDLDNKALPDLDRVATFLSDMRTPPGSVMLFGFADARGAADANLKLSRERAQTVAAEFKQRGISPAVVTGFGASLPVASNDSAEGQERNRRVEIWIKR